MFRLTLQIGLHDQTLVRKKRTLISNLIISNIINFQEHRNSRQFQYKEGPYVFEASLDRGSGAFSTESRGSTTIF